VHRSELTVDLGAIRRNTRTLLRALDGAALWAVVKADGYGHGAVDVAGAALGAGASALCVATLDEALELRRELPTARVLVLSPVLQSRAVAEAREANLELCVADGEIPDGVRCHLKLDTGMGRYGLSELPSPSREVVGVMSHLATADTDARFVERQIERFRRAVAASQLTRHLANSAGALRYPASHFDAARCGIALYGLSPFGEDPARDGLEPALRWESHLAQVRLLRPGESTGYGRRFVAERETWVGLVPVGYADGFRRDLTGTTVRVAGEPCRAVGTVSMDSFAVELPRELPVGTPVVLLGGGVSAEEHARVAGTITYELVTGINSDPRRARRTVVDA
jgi:alanine racemase